ncbi:MAG: efflux RND transporter permease subunit [Tissierellia bacterium]|nr:efflux RND transporter permease subunit [Tissierellia bacterium]
MLSKFSVKKPFTIIVAVILVLILGTVSFMNLKTDLLPSIDLPYVVVMTSYPGASPEEVEMVVTKPIEQLLATTSNIENVSSISRENSSTVILEFNNDVNMDSAIIEINGSLDLIKPNWNDDIGTPMIMKLNPDMLPIMVASIDVEDMDAAGITKLVSENIIPEFESIGGVASVEGVGLIEESIEVIISPEKIEKLNQKILASIDSELSKAENKLLEAKREIDTGKAKLDSENKKQSSKLAEGEKAIAMGKEQISSVESTIKSGEEELLKNREELQTSMNVLNREEEQLLNAKKQLESLGGNISEEQRKELEKVKLGLKTIAQNKIEINAGLDTITNKISELEKQKSGIEAQKTELNKQEEQIKEGKAVLKTEMNKAKAQLQSGEATLNQKMSELESAKEEAFKNASLDGVVTEEMISGILSAQNFSMPAGYVSENNTDYLVKVGDKIQDIEELKNLLLFDTGVEGVDKVYLSDVADIKNIDNSDNIYAKVNGNDAAVLTFQKQSNYSTAEVSNSIREKIDEITKDNKDISITPLMDQGIYIDIVVDSVLKNLLYGGILAILILILFLRDIRPTFIIALSIPISIIFAIAMMYFTGVTINIISLAGLALGVGMLVDNSIVVIENIYRLRNKGVSATKASIEGAREISGALLASTLTTAVVFLPIVFTKGISRQLFTDMGLTIAYSLFASLLVALTLVPTLASSILKDTKEKSHNLFDRFVNRYEIILRWSLKHKGLVIIGVIALLVVSGFLGIRMGTSFIPEMESPQMSITIELPKESTSEDIKLMTDTVVDRIIDIDGIETLGAFRAESMGGMGDNGNNNSMSIYVILDENKVSSNTEIGKQIKKLTEDLDCTINVNTSTMDMSALAGTGIEAIVKGREVDKLREISGDVAKILEETEGTAEVSDGLDENVMEIRVVVDKEKAMEEGLTVAQVFSNINTLVSKGKSSTTLTVNNKDYPVIVVDGENQNMTRSDLENLTIELDKDGEETSVKLMDIAEVSQEHGLSSIKRDSQERYISITANIDDDYNIGLVSREFEKKLKDYKVPDGYKIEISGETEMINESLKDLFYMLILAIAFIYLIMVAQFQSLLSPFIVMFTIPLAFTGGFLALAITGYDLSIISMLGFLVLSGVVVNNGIVFVDYTNQLRESGMEKTESLILAGKTRMRPILMTAITTILGLSTLSFGVGMGAEMLQPLAIASIGGLTYATILTLIFVPVMYDILHRNKLGKTSDKGDE